MNLKKLLALMIAALLLVSLIPAAGASTGEEPVNAEKSAESLLAFASGVHEMKTRFAPKISRAEAAKEPFANARIIVKYSGELDYTGSVAHTAGYNDWHIIQYRSADEARSAAEKYLKIKGVKYAAPDTVMSLTQEPHTNSFLSWGFGASHVDAFNYNEWLLDQAGSVDNLPEIIVGVLDTGVDSDHEFLSGRLVAGYDFVNNDSDPEDEHYHGTHVSGTIVDGTLPNVKIMGLRVLDADGYGDTSDIVEAMEYANLHGCKVANLSLRGPRDSQSEQLYTEVINNGADNGTVYCIASGNDSGSSEDYLPGAVARSFTVAAHEQDHSMAYFSNTGPSVDITAPGVDIRSAAKGGGYRVLSGTSMATPHVSAACAMVYCYAPDMDPDDVVSVLKAAAIDVGLSGGGTGILNVTDLLKYDNALNGEGTAVHFTSPGTYPWAVDSVGAHSTNAGAANSVSTLLGRAELAPFCEITFDYKVSSQQNHDYLRFSVNGEVQFETSGETGWQTYTGVIPAAGGVELKWEFAKDASGNTGSDCAWVKNVNVSKTISSVLNGEEADLLFENSGTYPWVIDGNAAKSGNAGVNNSVSEVTASRHIEAGLTIRFSYKTECGTGDVFRFLVNGETVLEKGSSTAWTEYEYTCENEGDYTFTFSYIKNGSGAVGSDCAWVKGVSIIFSLSSALNVPGGDLVFNSTGSYPWIAENNYAKSGNAGAASSSSSLTLNIFMNPGDTLSFRYKVSSESNYDWMYFNVNGSQVFRYSGNVGWTQYTYTATTAQNYTFEWKYTKDYSLDSGDDCAYLDDVCLTVVHSSIPGDVDMNGVVEVTDALLAMRYAMGLIGSDGLDLEAMDIDGDGTYTISDAVIILRMAMGLV